MKTTFIKQEKHGENIFSFSFKKPKGYFYIAGQFIELTLLTTNIYNKRWFTLSSSPSEDQLTITTKLQSRSDYKDYLQKLRRGDVVDISQAMGDFVLPKDSTIPILFVAGGIGITPVRSIIHWLHDIGERRTIRIIYATHNKLFIEDFRMNNTDVLLFNKSQGRISASLIKQETEFLGQNGLIYISGPEEMVEQLFKQLQELDFSSNRLVGDYFSGYEQS